MAKGREREIYCVQIFPLSSLHCSRSLAQMQEVKTFIAFHSRAPQNAAAVFERQKLIEHERLASLLEIFGDPVDVLKLISVENYFLVYVKYCRV